MLRIRTEDGRPRTDDRICLPSSVPRRARSAPLGPERSEDPLLARTISKEITLTNSWSFQSIYSLYTGLPFFTPHIWSFFFMSYSFISHQLFN